MGCTKIRDVIDSLDDLRDINGLLTPEEGEHFAGCDDCQKLVKQYSRADNLVQSMAAISPPAEISQSYMAGLFQKLEHQTRTAAPHPRGRILPRLRLAMAGVAIVLVSIAVWRLGDFTEPVAPAEDLTSDSLDYYLESFNEASSVNPIYVVKEMDYDWTEYEIPIVAQE